MHYSRNTGGPNLFEVGLWLAMASSLALHPPILERSVMTEHFRRSQGGQHSQYSCIQLITLCKIKESAICSYLNIQLEIKRVPNRSVGTRKALSCVTKVAYQCD